MKSYRGEQVYAVKPWVALSILIALALYELARKIAGKVLGPRKMYLKQRMLLLLGLRGVLGTRQPN